MPASPAQSSLTVELAVKKSVARFSNEDAVIEYGARYVGGPNGRVEDQTAWEGLRDVVDDFSQDGSCSDASYYIALRNEIALSPRPSARGRALCRLSRRAFIFVLVTRARRDIVSNWDWVNC
jgi:hypothetical protein